MRAAVEPIVGGDPIDGLVDAACRLLDVVRVRIEDRETAYDLLAADGLLSLACEAAATYDAENLATRCREIGPGGRLGELAALWAERS